MALNQSEYQIKIKSTADNSGVESAQKGIKDLGAAAEGSATSEKKVHETLRLLSDAAANSLGPIGQLAHFLLSPELLAGAGLVFAVHELNKEVERTTEILMENMRVVREASEAHVKAIADVRRERAAADAEYERQVAHVMDGEDRMAKLSAQRVTAFDKEMDAQKTLAEIESSRIDKYVDFLQAKGKITPEQAKDMKSHLKQAQADRIENAEENKLANKIREDTGLAADDQLKLNAQKNLPQDLRAQSDGRQLQIKDLDDKISAASDKRKTLDDAAKEAEADAAQREWSKRIIANPNGYNAADIETAKTIQIENWAGEAFGITDESVTRKAKGLRGSVDTEDAWIASMNRQKADLEEQQKNADARIKQIEDENLRLAKSVADLAKAIEEQTAELNAKKTAYGQTRQENQRSIAADQIFGVGAANATPKEISIVESSQGDLAGILKALLKEAQETARLARAHVDTGGNIGDVLQQIHAILASSNDLTSDQLRKLLTLQQQFEELKRQQDLHGQRLDQTGNVGG